jgi:hypothetical protein
MDEGQQGIRMAADQELQRTGLRLNYLCHKRFVAFLRVRHAASPGGVTIYYARPRQYVEKTFAFSTSLIHVT